MGKQTIGQRIREQRVERGLTQDDLANALGITYQAVSQWEKGITSPRGKRLAALCDTLECKKLWLLFGEDLEEEHSTPYRAVSESEAIYSPDEIHNYSTGDDRVADLVRKLLQLAESPEGERVLTAIATVVDAAIDKKQTQETK